MASLVAARHVALASLTAEEVRALVPPALPQSCSAFVEVLTADGGPALDGASLAEMTSAKRVRESVAFKSVAHEFMEKQSCTRRLCLSR